MNKIVKYDGGGYFKNGIKKSDVLPTKNQQIANLGFGNVPFNNIPKEALNKVTFYDEKDGSKVNIDKMSREDFNKAGAYVNTATGEFLDPARIERGDDGNALYLSTKNEPTVRPYYGYKIVQQPYYDQFRNYKVPVKNTDEAINNATNNLGMKGVEVTPFEDGEYFETPQLIGEDNWEDPLDNAVNWAFLGGASAARKGLGKYLWNPTVNFLKSFAPGTKGGNVIGTAAKDIAIAEGLVNLQRLLFGNSAGDYIYNKAYNFENNYDNWFTRNRVLSTATDFFGRPEYYPINVLAKPVEYGINNVSRYINSIPKQYDPIRNLLELGMYSSSGRPSISTVFENAIRVGRGRPEIRYAPLKYLFTFNPEKKMRIANQVMDAFNYNGLVSYQPRAFPVSKAGFNPIRAGLYGEYGTMSPYIRDIKPSDIHYDWSRKHNPSIKVIDAPYSSPLEHEGRTPMNTTQTSDKPNFRLGDHYSYDAGGHLIKYLPESIQASDVYKFNPSDYMKKWINSSTSGKVARLLNKSVLGAIDRRFTDFVFQLQPSRIPPESIQASDVFKFTPSDFVLLDKFFKAPEAIQTKSIHN